VARFTREQIECAKSESRETFWLVQAMRHDAKVNPPQPITGLFPYFRR
jgi:hypothetical protein